MAYRMTDEHLLPGQKLHPLAESLWFRYPAAFVLGAFALLLTYFSWDLVQKVVFIFFFPAVILASVLFGFRPGFLVALLGAFGVNYFLIEPKFGFSFQPADIWASIAFAALGGLVAWVGGSRRQKERALRQRTEQLGMSESALRNSKEALERTNETLEERVKERTEELSRSREALHQAQKMEAIGRLAGGVAHDFNNLLTGILGIAEELKSTIPDSAQREDVGAIIGAAEKASKLTRQLLAFGRQQIAQPILLNLNEAVADMGALLSRIVGEDIVLLTQLDPALRTVRMDPTQIEQIIMNLVLNARDAMPKGGRLTIETKNVILSEQYTRSHFEIKPGQYVLLAVSDTGTGMDAPTAEKVFEPFFTTKAQGKGTGMGLATVHGIVKQNSGDVSVYSNLGLGTTFKIYLPAHSVGAGASKPALGLADRRSAAEATAVLVVEDEDIVRRVAVSALRKEGYQVLEAPNGRAALDTAAAYSERIDLLLTDVVMPGMNGRELADELLMLRPNMAVIYMSGYTQNIVVKRGILKPGINFIEKAFTPDQLVTKVRTILENPGRAPVQTK
jgi:signal transduction histidine kinase/CheY-like chemotaxis protein